MYGALNESESSSLMTKRDDGLALPRNYSEQTRETRMNQLREEASNRSQMAKPGSLVEARRPNHKKKKSGTVFQNVFADDSRNIPQETNDLIGSNGRPRHSWLYSMMNPHSKRKQAVAFKHFIGSVIVMDLIMYIISTDPHVARSREQFFYRAEGVVSVIFLLEYLLRLCIITEKHQYGKMGPIYGRLYYAFWTWGAWIDLLATAPFFVELVTGLSLPTLTCLRVFRLFRILKTESYVRALDAVYRVIYYNGEILYVATLVCLFLTMATAILLYVLRPEHDEENDFTSIASTLYLSTLLLTGQGGPSGTLPWYTKSIVLLTSLFSVAMFAIPASMLTWGFEAEAERMAKRALQKAKKQKDPNHEIWSCTSSDGGTTDEEYFKLIAGGGESDEDESPFMKQAREQFKLYDNDGDGTLTLTEAAALMSGQQHGNLDSLTSRVEGLETNLKHTNDKLDRILGLLEQTNR